MRKSGGGEDLKFIVMRLLSLKESKLELIGCDYVIDSVC